MNNSLCRYVTCTPVAFHANEYFYTRDTGLICKELQKQGAGCRVMMPLPAHEDDLPTGDLLRVEARKLYSAAWWQSLGLEGVILYSWGDPRYTGIARAIHRAGLKLLIHFDSSGELHEHLSRQGNKWVNKIKDMVVNWIRSKHLGYADVITTSQPCVEAFRSDIYYGASIADKCREFPTAVHSCFHFNGGVKQQRVICTGSWQHPVKRVEMLMSTLKLLLRQHNSMQVDICGPATPALQSWHADLPNHQQERIHLHGFCSHAQLSELYNRACISLCTSESEGSHGASAEALCCGCSVVCPPRPLLSVVQWYTSRGSGTVATEDTPEQLCRAVLAELEKWQNGERSATEIATAWQPSFQVSQLAGWLS